MLEIFNENCSKYLMPVNHLSLEETLYAARHQTGFHISLTNLQNMACYLSILWSYSICNVPLLILENLELNLMDTTIKAIINT